MQKATKTASLLILRGVFPRDFAPAAPKLTPGFVEPTISYTEMPKRFTGVENWIKSSNLLCWFCSLGHTNVPAFVPLNPTVEGHCDVHGHFCSWSCAAGYVRIMFSRDQVPDILEAVARFEAKFSGQRRQIVVASPQRTEMRAYCGNSGLTVAQWQDRRQRMQADYNLAHYKMTHLRGDVMNQ